MTARRFPDAGQFCRETFEFLMRDEGSHNLLLGLCSALADCPSHPHPSTCLTTVEEDGRVLGAAVHTPPYNVVLSHMPSHAAALLAREMHAARQALPGVHGPSVPAEMFARAWETLTGHGFTVRRRMRVFQLDAVVPARRARGALRCAAREDVDMVTDWFRDFNREALAEDSPADHAARIQRRVEDGIVFLWIHEDRPVSMACAGGTTPSGIRISGVYTPPQYRGRGFASACVAALSRRLLAIPPCRHCFLYTDLQNPVSARLYAAIGFHPICDVLDIAF